MRLDRRGRSRWVLRHTRDDSLARQVDRFFLKARARVVCSPSCVNRNGACAVASRWSTWMAFAWPWQPSCRATRPISGAPEPSTASTGACWPRSPIRNRAGIRAPSRRAAQVGLMMLTADTARGMGGGDRLDAARIRSIAGAALPGPSAGRSGPIRWPEPDRTWLTLAAYNLGPGGLARARRAVRGAGRRPGPVAGGAPAFPPLVQRGARGWEPVYHVESVRRYFALLSADGAPDEQAVLGLSRRAGPAASVDGDAGSAPGRTRHSSETG